MKSMGWGARILYQSIYFLDVERCWISLKARFVSELVSKGI